MRKAPFFLALLAALTLGGCASMQQTGAALSTAPQSAKIVVQYAAMKFIEKAGAPSAQQARAARVVDVAGKVQGLIDAGLVSTAPLIEQAVRDSINWSQFSPADRLLVDNLIALVRQELEARIGSAGAPLDSQQLIVVRDLLGWVVAAARLAS